MAVELLSGPGKSPDENGRPFGLQLGDKEGYDHAHVIRMRCPECRLTTRLETLEKEGQDYAVELRDGTKAGLGVRHCPNEACAQLIFVAYDRQEEGPGALFFTAPAEALDFDTTNLPSAVEAAMAEAAVCFSSGCYTAAAIMIRKTLEEVCADRQAEGGNLKQRIEALSKIVILPVDLVAGLDALRLLGNDAAHIESKTFSEIGRPEVQLSFDVVKEILKGVYQYSALIASLNELKKNQP
ncbi:DUF4145 domain-containing protein [Kribbella sp. NPDC051620]|uniref:DUF4145 domain-containing protein n=1 Tax=Kribbella sp. NPDC051620 TaxID=3364120 RepID=UPI00379AE17F